MLHESTQYQARLLDLFFQHSLDTIVLLDKDYNYIRVSETYAKACQRDASEFAGRNHFELYPSDLKDELEAFRLNKKIYKKTARPFTFPDHPEWGTSYWDIGMVPILDRDGEIEFFLFTLKNVSARIRAEEELTHNIRLLNETQAMAFMGSWQWDITENSTEWSSGLYEIFGITPEQLKPNAYEGFLNCVHPDDREGVVQALQQCLATKVPLEINYRIVRPDGEQRNIYARAEVSSGSDGNNIKMLGISQDVTDRMRAEKELSENQRTLSSLMNNMPGMFYRCKNDADWTVEFASTGALALTGYAVEEFMTHAVSFGADVIHPDDQKAIWGQVQAGLNEKRSYQISYRIQTREGIEKWVWEQGNGIYSSSGELLALEGFITDISERVHMEEALRDSQDRLALATHAAGVGIWDWDIDKDELLWDDSMFQLYGIRREDFIGAYDAWQRCVHKDDLSGVDAKIQTSISEKVPFETEFRIFKSNGELRYIKAFADVICDDHGNAIRMVGTNWDISQRKKTEESMRMAASIYQSSAEAIMVMDENNHIIDVNPAFTRITGYEFSEVAGKDPELLRSGRHDQAFYDDIWQKIKNEGHWQGELWDRRKDGELYIKWNSISVIRHPDGSVYRYIAQFSDITEKKEKDKLIWNQANYDLLTGLPNRRLFSDRLDQELKKAHRTELPLALLFIDLDRFKEINDTMGHAKGDLMLEEAAQRISACVRETDTLARLGGDEFTAILPDYGERLQIERIAQHIINELSKPFYFHDDDNGYYISASIGITLFPDDAENIEGLLKNADQAMYQAKEEGRQRFSYFTSSMQLEAREKLALTHDLRKAMANHELHVYYQPIIHLASNRIVKSEALLRWIHPKRGMISPVVFIPLAEESGLIHEIGEWVFQEAITSVEEWRNKFGRIVPVSVNRSPIQFEYNPNHITWVNRLESLGLPGYSITVEITEGMLLKESFRTRQQLIAYRNSGIEVSIDDFGTGFSALSYLKRFDIDYLKIDRSFINRLNEDESDKVLTEAIILMAHKLGIQTIAEGVETEEQRDLLISFGCDHAQGFFYSPAVPAEEFEKMLKP